jgi:hypothetical protein
MDETNNNLEPTQITPMSSEQASITQELVQPVTEQIIIGEELTADDVNRIYTKLGRPESPDKYDLSGIVPDTYNQDVLEQFKQKAHETGMSQEGVRKMAEWYKEVEVKQHEAINKARAIQDDQHIMTLKTELGANFDAEVKNARKALDAYTDKAFKQYMDESGLGNHPALVKAFAKIGRELSEDRLVQSDTATRLAKNDELRKSEILRLRGNKEFMEKYRRGEPTAVQRLNSLYSDD